MKKDKLFLALLISAAIVAALDLAFIIYAACSIPALSNEGVLLNTSFRDFAIIVTVFNALLAVCTAAYLVIKKISFKKSEDLDI